jgi:hypothetical protein
MTLDQVKAGLRKNLEQFDYTWVSFEKLYVLELMNIEADARKFITDAIEIEKDLSDFERKEKSKGRIILDSIQFNKLRAKLTKIVSQINSVANPEGTGRDDLGIEILIAAENVSRKVS